MQRWEGGQYRRRELLFQWHSGNVQLHSASTRRQVQRFQNLRVKLTGMAQDHISASHLHGSAAAWVPGKNVRCLQLDIHTGGAGDLAGGFDGVGVAICASFAPRALMLDIAGGHRCNVQRLLRKGIQKFGNNLIGRSLLHGRHRRGLGALECHLLQTIQGEVAAATRNIAADGLQHVRKQSRGQDGLICLKRILHLYGAAASIILVQAPHIKGVVGHERGRQYLCITGIGQAVANSAATLLCWGETATAGWSRQDSGNVLQALKT